MNRQSALVAITALSFTAAAHATFYDLTHANTSVSIADAIYETADFRPAGTGYIDPFVRIQSNGTEQGYNTSARPTAYNEKTDGNYTHDVQLQNLGTRIINGNVYFQFSLDINETNSAGGRTLSLDQVKIYVSPTGMHNSTDLNTLGALVYTLDTAGNDNWVKLDYSLNSGSGQGDMKMYIPVSRFAGYSGSSYVTLYSQFGTNDASSAGFEEWTTVGTLIPAPGAGALLGLGGLALLRRRR